jgi:serine/threonine-protein kinase
VAPVGSDPRVGTELAGYRLEALLGRGGMGAVYLAEDAALGRKVAVKLLAPALTDNQRFRDRFLRESQIAASLDHPHVVPIYGAGEADGQLFLAMRYVEGSDLRELLAREGPLAPERALALLAQVAGALDAAHARGLVHRDVKPGNVLVAAPAEHCYLADFGLTKQTASVSGLTGTGELVGTVEYVSPEQIRGDPVDARSDVYSLACVLYECLAGKSPFERDSEVATLWAHVNEPPPALGIDLDELLARALDKSPAARPATCGALIGEAREALGLGGAPRRRRTGRRLRRWTAGTSRRARRRSVLLPAVVVALAAALAALVLAWPSTASLALEPGTVGVLDAQTGEIVKTIHTGTEPTEVVATPDGRSVWVANSQDRSVSRIDPVELVTTKTVPAAGRLPRLAAAADAVYVSSADGRILRLGPRYGEVERETDLYAAEPTTAVPLAVGRGALWVGDNKDGVLRRLDRASLRPTGTTDLATFMPAIAVGDGSIWAIGSGSTVHRINPVSGSLTKTYDVGAGPLGIASGAGAAWVACTEGNVVTWISAFGSGVESIEVGRAPLGITAGGGSVWVANGVERTISRIDPETRKVVGTIELGDVSPRSLAFARGLLFVTALPPLPA